MKLSKTERKFIAPAVNYRYKIESVGIAGRFAWDGDPLCMVTVGPVCRKMVMNGILDEFAERHSSWFKLSKLGEKYRCNSCLNGELYTFDEEQGFDVAAGKCAKCDGIGVLPLARSKVNIK